MEVSEKAQEYLAMIKKREELDRQITAIGNELIRLVTSNPRARLVRRKDSYKIASNCTYIAQSVPIPGTDLCVVWYELRKT